MKNLLFFIVLAIACTILLADIVGHNPVQAQNTNQVVIVKPVIPKYWRHDGFSSAGDLDAAVSQAIQDGYFIQSIAIKDYKYYYVAYKY